MSDSRTVTVVQAPTLSAGIMKTRIKTGGVLIDCSASLAGGMYLPSLVDSAASAKLEKQRQEKEAAAQLAAGKAAYAQQLAQQCSGVQLVTDAFNWHTDSGYAQARGQVTNVSGARMEHVEAVVTYTTSSGEFITSDDALIEYDPILAGQTSPFHVLTRANPAMSGATLEFKELMGGTLTAMNRKDYDAQCRG